MSTSRQGDDGPAVLQLCRWTLSETHLKLSKFREAFISPTRRLFGLLSDCGDLVLATVEVDPSQVELPRALSDTCTQAVFETISSIPGVKSLAWGYCSDASSQLEDSGFNEILVVSSDASITVHAFCRSRKSTLTVNSTFDAEELHGEWKEWRPTECSVLEDGESDSKNWFRSFLTSITASVSSGKYQARFPVKSLLPHSAEVVSFSLYDITLSFLKFWYNKCSPKTMMETDSESPQSFFSSLPLAEASCSCQWECLKVLSSSSGYLIGLVLTPNDSVTCEAHLCNTECIVVAVLELNQWGIQWNFVADLQDIHVGAKPGPKWVDFRLSDMFLACLNATGFVAIWNVKTGDLATSFSVLQQCRTGLEMPPRSTMPDETNLDGGNISVESFAGRMFKRLVLASYSHLLAVVDEVGVVYVFYADDTLNFKANVFENFDLSVTNHFGDCLSAWEAAGHEIGSLSFSTHQSRLGSLNPAKLVPEVSGKNDVGIVRPRKRRKCRCDENEVDSWPSGFVTTRQMKVGASYPDTLNSSSTLRRILLPPCRSHEDVISLSPLGLTRVFKGSNADGNEHVKVFHTELLMYSSFLGERDIDVGFMDKRLPFKKDSAFVGDSVVCSCQGYLYLITQYGLSVVLPPVSISSFSSHGNAIKLWQPGFAVGSACNALNLLSVERSEKRWKTWQIEVLDRALLYEGPALADRLCWENGWDLKVSRLRWLQLVLHYSMIGDLEQSLNMLAEVNLAEEGVLQLLLASIHRLSGRSGSDNEVAVSSRLMVLAVRFATRMIKCYGLQKQNTDMPDNSEKLLEMSSLLMVIRSIQHRVSAKNQNSIRTGDDKNSLKIGTEVLQNDSSLSVVVVDGVSSGPSGDLDAHDRQESAHVLVPDSNSLLALAPVELSLSASNFHDINTYKGTAQDGRQIIQGNIKEMINRWETNNFDLKTVVREALQSGRLPLAVLQLQLLRQRELVSNEDSEDAFSEVHEIGRSIVYDLLMKGETELAVVTLERLGDDVESDLRQLMQGTVRRSLRLQIAEEMKKRGFVRSNEWKMLETLTLIERFYPSSSFWDTYFGRENVICDAANIITLPGEDKPALSLHIRDQPLIECGDVDGTVLGSWVNINDCTDSKEFSGSNISGGYWACAAVWSDAWDQRTVDRILLDQPYDIHAHIPWESQFEYFVSHNDAGKVGELLDMIPNSVLLEGIIRVNVDSLQAADNTVSDLTVPDYNMYICDSEELEPVCMEIPHVKVFRSLYDHESTSYIRMLIQQELAKKHIFVKEYWKSTSAIIPLLACAGMLIKVCPRKEYSTAFSTSEVPDDANHQGREGALHKLVIRFCVQYNLPYLLELYLDNCNWAPVKDCIPLLKDAAGDCKWAQWLLFSRIKGHEYEASFSNACWNLSQKMISSSNLTAIEIDDMLYTVDDMAERISEMSALATLMYASAPIQKSICTGSVNRSRGLPSQCTLENLGPCLQQFPTLWKTLHSACFGQDEYGCLNYSPANVFGKSSISEYLRWRYSIFSSSGGDTSLLQMLPCWVPKSIKRLIQLFEQGPFGMQLLSSTPSEELFSHNVTDYIYNSTGYTDTNALSLEASIQKSVEEELYSSLEEKDVRVEHHLHRGRALAAFRHLLVKRASQLKSASARQVIPAQSNVQADVQLILAPLSHAERLILISVAPLAITNFEDSTLVASCIFLLELCGLCANMLRLDIAALRRISSHYKSVQQNKHFDLSSPMAPELHVQSHGADIAPALARALAEDYVQSDHLHVLEQTQTSMAPKREQTPQPLIAILQHLEKASLPSLDEGKTCGFWLLTGIGDASLYRSQQNEASQHWNLVTEFCRAHHLPLSTKYLALLANDNDWVGFLTEAQIAGFPVEVVIEVAAKEIRDSRLRTHILTVLKNMMSLRRKSSSNIPSGSSDSSFSAVDGNNPMELFGILGVCEKQKNPGEALLNKAKQMQWSLLAMIASCFPDVTPLSCLSVWLEITAAREMSSIKVDDISSKIAKNVGSAVEATNKLPGTCRNVEFRYNRKNPKRRRFLEASPEKFTVCFSLDSSCGPNSAATSYPADIDAHQERGKPISGETVMFVDIDERLASLSSMVAVLCEHQLFLPLLRAFEMFLPSCSLISFIRSLQAFSQMRLPEASAHLASFSVRIKDEASHTQLNSAKEVSVLAEWVAATAVKAADAVLSTCPSIYEKRCLLQLLSGVDFGDGGSSSSYFSRRYWKINLSEPSLHKDTDIYDWNDLMDDACLLTSLEKDGQWEQARTWARQLESTDIAWESTLDHVTESQAEAMVAEWKEFLWDIPQERAALWGHCQSLFMRYSFPPLKAGLFFLKHAEAVGKEIPSRELHDILLLSLQWLSGTMTKSSPVYPLHILRDIETRVWLLAVESESQPKADGEFATSDVAHNIAVGNGTSIIEQTADVITKIDSNMGSPHMKATERNGIRDNLSPQHVQFLESNSEASSTTTNNTRAKRRGKTNLPLRRGVNDNFESRTSDLDNNSNNFHSSKIGEQARNLLSGEEFAKMEESLSGWEQNVRPVDMEKAVLSLLEFGQIIAAKQLQQKLSPSYIPEELVLVDVALRIANNSSTEISLSCVDTESLSILQSLGVASSSDMIDPLQVMEKLAVKCGEGRGRALIRRIIAVIRTAKLLGLPFSEAFEKQPIELLQLLSLKAQDSFDEAKFLVETHIMPASSIARILADSFLKGLLAAHRGGYLDSQKEEGPAPLLWRSSDFLKWAKLCPSEPEIGHALMRLVMTGHEVPHACEVELLILSHHFYMSSSCLDGVDVLVTFAANRVDSYVLEGDFPCLAHLITGVSNFHSLSFILSILVENGQLELLLQKYSATDTATGTPASVRGFRMAVITSLKQFNPNDDDALSMVYRHFDMKHEAASLLELRAEQYMNSWLSRYDKERRNDELLEAMHHLVETAEVLSTIDAGQRTHRACARASLLSLQIRIPDLLWIGLSETNARRIFVEQSRFQEALIVAESYSINQPMEWAPVFWNQMLKPDLIEQFVAEFVSVLPLQPPMLLELARFYRAEVAARGEQSHFSVWLSPGGLPAEWVKHLGRSFRSLLRRTRDMRLRLQLATLATGFVDVLDMCNKVLDKVPENVGPLILRKGHGGAYLPLM